MQPATISAPLAVDHFCSSVSLTSIRVCLVWEGVTILFVMWSIDGKSTTTRLTGRRVGCNDTPYDPEVGGFRSLGVHFDGFAFSRELRPGSK